MSRKVRREIWLVEPLECRRLCSLPPTPLAAAHWAFDEGSGTTAADSSGNGHTGTLGAGVTWAAGNVGTNAISLNGTASAVVTATGPVVNTAGSFTVSAWVDLASLSGYQTVLSIAGVNIAGFFLQLRGDTGTFSFTRLASDSTAAAGTEVNSPTAPVIGTWYHLVGVDDATAGTLTLYVDGQSQGSAAYTGGWSAGGNTLIGHGFYNGGEVDYVNGSIDEVEMFSSALSAAQVVALDQPAEYSFDDITGTSVPDDSGHGNTLTLGSGASVGPAEIGTASLAVNGTITGNATYPSPVINTALPFSVSAWVYLNSLTGYQTFVSIDGQNTSAFYLQLSGSTGKFSFARRASDSDTATPISAGAIGVPSIGQWYNLIGVNDVATGQILLYVNGILQSTASNTGAWSGTGPTVIGGGQFSGVRTDFVNGDIDQVVFYDSPLSAGDANYVGNGGVYASTININTASTGVTVSPDLFGAFMEDINYSGEGGVYNDEVRNSGFNDSTNPLNSWAAVAGAGVNDSLASDTTTGPTSGLTQSGALTITSGVSATARAGISNAGYFGVGIAPSTSYSAQFYAKATAGFTGPLTVDLESTTGAVFASATVSAISTAWTPYTVTLTTNASAPTTATNLFVISTNSATATGSTIWFGATYLYPPSYQGAANHLRIDLMQTLAALKPAIFRVPGGNYLEGNDYATRFEWSNTIGPIPDRPGHYNSAWGYWSTDGMGLDEYLQMADEVGALPILAVYAGYTLDGASDTGQTLTNDVTDAVNELHYVLDPITTGWGALRDINGHPAPYNVNYAEIGNEDFFSSTYSTRYPLFYNAIHAAFPQLQIIATSSSTGGSPYNVLDEHFYNSPAWFEANSNYYDNVARGTSQVFVGEYASGEGSPTNDLDAALGDSCWLLGMERNSDLVTLSSYAPLWVNVNGFQATPNLIGFNNTTVYGSPSYYAEILLGQNHGTTVVNDTLGGSTGIQTLVTRTGSTYYLTVINTLGAANNTTVNLSGVTAVSATGTWISMGASSDTATNSITQPANIVPVTTAVSGLGTTFTESFPAYSITVLKFSADSAPTVATAAAATPSPVIGTTTNLSVLGADNAGESTLTYTWAATGPVPVTFSVNGTNAAKNTTAKFTAAGSYTFVVTIANAVGQTSTSSVTVIVNQTFTSIAVTPATASIFDGQTNQFTATAKDQFGNPLTTQPAFTWSVGTGSAGTISSAGLYSAPAAGPASDIVTAGSGSVTGTATATVILSVIDGTPGNDTIHLIRSGGNLLVYIDSATPTYNVSFAPLGSLSIAGGTGTDTINIDFSGGATPVPSGGVTINGIGGSDTLIVTGTTGVDLVSVNAAQVICNGSAITYSKVQSIVIDGNGGADTLIQTAQPAASLTFNGGAASGPTSTDTLNVSGGTFVFPAPTANDQPVSLSALSIENSGTVFLATAAGNRSVLVLGSLILTGSSAQLDLGGNDLIVHNTGSLPPAQSLANVTAELRTGYASAAWTGPGIASSAAHNSSTHLMAPGVMLNQSLSTFDGQSVTNTDVLVKYTYYGDANLDGKVDGSDYSRLDNGCQSHTTGWSSGDFNYDGVIDGSDYALIDNSFNTQGTAIPSVSVGTQERTSSKAIAAGPRSVFSSMPIDTDSWDESFAKKRRARIFGGH